MAKLKYSSTKDIKVPDKLIEQVIGQDMAVDVIRKAQVQVIAEIVSPLEATDSTVSINQPFIVRAHLVNYGQAGFKLGNCSLE